MGSSVPAVVVHHLSNESRNEQPANDAVKECWAFFCCVRLIFLSPLGYPLVLALFYSFRFRLSRNNKARGRSLVVCDWELNDKSIRFTDDFRPSTFCLLAT